MLTDNCGRTVLKAHNAIIVTNSTATLTTTTNRSNTQLIQQQINLVRTTYLHTELIIMLHTVSIYSTKSTPGSTCRP